MSESKYTCSSCGQMFNSRSTLKKHEIIAHATGEALTCDVCQKRFAFSFDLTRHRIAHSSPYSDTEHVCSHCGKCFTSSSSLRKHVSQKHGSSETHVCPMCRKEFSSPRKLKEHALVHFVGRRMFVCHLCPKSFKEPLDLYLHVHSAHIHKGEFVCPVCEKVFCRKPALKRHIIELHSTSESSAAAPGRNEDDDSSPRSDPELRQDDELDKI